MISFTHALVAEIAFTLVFVLADLFMEEKENRKTLIYIFLAVSVVFCFGIMCGK